MNLTKLIQVAEKCPQFFVSFLKWVERLKSPGKNFAKCCVRENQQTLNTMKIYD